MTDKIDSFRGKYEFLSNFYPVEIFYDGYWYPTLEHAFQAAKTLDLKEREMVREQATPGKAKQAGHSVHLRPDWEGVKVAIMKGLLQQKFFRHALGTRLLDTGGAELIEGNTWNDRFWGVCRGEGENHLGRLLMQVRADMRFFVKHTHIQT